MGFLDDPLVSLISRLVADDGVRPKVLRSLCVGGPLEQSLGSID